MNTTAKPESDGKLSKSQRIFSVIRTVLVYLLAILIVLFAVLFAADKSPSKSVFGFRYYVVLTPSMEPELSPGDMVFVKITDSASIQVNDVITFNPSGSNDAYLTHRVVEKLDNFEGSGVTCFRTKGDANDTADSFLIDESRVVGKVKFHIPKLGTVLRFIQLRWYFIVPLVILFFAFLELMKYYFHLKGSVPEEEHQETPAGQGNSDDQ
ncbi:MAG: signal peptidase I [Oscillospiraceae bacterium]|nr:signal peptidase I [Oscillospiraceae bacterium]